MRNLAISLCLAALAVPGLAGAASAETPCTYYAAPLKEDGGRVPDGEPYAIRFAFGTPDQPIPVSDFWTRKLVKPGTVLCLKDGEYRGKRSMVLPPPNRFAGKPDARVVVRAVNEGRVWIDGGFERGPLRLEGHSYWTVEGLNLYNSRAAVVAVAGRRQKDDRDQEATHHVVLRRLVAWRDYLPYGNEEAYGASGGANTHIFSLADVADVLVEDCAGFGWARTIFQNYRSKRVIFRRNWARWDGRHPFKGGESAFACSNSGYDAICENLIATVGGSHDPSAQPADYAPGIQLISALGRRTGMRWLEPEDRDPFDLGLQLHGSLAFAPPGARFERVTGILMGAVSPLGGQKGVTISDTVVALASSTKPTAGLYDCDDDLERDPEGCSWMRQADASKAPLRIERTSLIGSASPHSQIGEDWSASNVESRSWQDRGDVYRRSAGGASLCHRYVDGRETELPLWPWPMQDRIEEATQRSNWPTADVMSSIAELFGKPPAECRAD